MKKLAEKKSSVAAIAINGHGGQEFDRAKSRGEKKETTIGGVPGDRIRR